MRVVVAIVLAFIVVGLTACSTGTESTMTFSGKVIDGYITGAKVCLDINSNLACDSNEPSTVTDIFGAYKFDYAGSIDGMLVLADVQPGAIDFDLGVITDAFSLLTPAESASTGKGAITPLTTLVSIEVIETGKSVAAAEQSVIANNNLSATSLVGYDFVAAKDSNLLAVAQVTAAAIAETAKQIKAASDAAGLGLSKAEAMKAAISEVKTSVLPSVIGTNGAALVNLASGTKQADVIALVKQLAPIDQSTISGKIQNIVVSTKSGDGKVLDLKNVFEKGMVVAQIDSGGDYIDDSGNRIDGNWGGYKDALEVEYLKGNTTNLMDESFRKVLVGSGSGKWFKAYTNTLPKAVFYPGASKWEMIEDSDGIADTTPIFSDNCIFLPAGEKNLVGMRGCATAKDLSGKKVVDFIQNLCESGGKSIEGCNKNAVFPANSYAINFSLTSTDDLYEIWLGHSWANDLPDFVAQLGTRGNVALLANCRVLLWIKSISPAASYVPGSRTTGQMAWARNETGCNRNNMPVSESESTQFTIEQVGGKDILKVLLPNLYRAVKPGDMSSYSVFGQFQRPSGEVGVFLGDFSRKNISFLSPYTGNFDSSPQFMNTTAFDTILKLKGIAPFPYPK